MLDRRSGGGDCCSARGTTNCATNFGVILLMPESIDSLFFRSNEDLSFRSDRLGGVVAGRGREVGDGGGGPASAELEDAGLAGLTVDGDVPKSNDVRRFLGPGDDLGPGEIPVTGRDPVERDEGNGGRANDGADVAELAKNGPLCLTVSGELDRTHGELRRAGCWWTPGSLITEPSRRSSPDDIRDEAGQATSAASVCLSYRGPFAILAAEMQSSVWKLKKKVRARVNTRKSTASRCSAQLLALRNWQCMSFSYGIMEGKEAPMEEEGSVRAESCWCTESW